MDVDETVEQPETSPAPARRRRRRTSPSSSPQPTARFTRRAEKSAHTLRELIKLRRPDLDVTGLSFLEVVERDADAWGRAIAQAGEWLVPFGRVVDLIFGQPLLILLNLAPSVRAGRRDLAERRARRAEERAREQAQAEEEELRRREGEPEFLPER